MQKYIKFLKIYRCPPNCAANPSDPRCPRPTTQRPLTTQFVCTPGSTDLRCPPNCYPGSRDPRCPKPSTVRPTTQPPTYLPPETTRYVQTTRTPAQTTATRFICTLGSTDPR